MFNSFYQPIPAMKIGGEVDWGRKNTFTEIEAEALRYYLVVHYDFQGSAATNTDRGDRGRECPADRLLRVVRRVSQDLQR